VKGTNNEEGSSAGTKTKICFGTNEEYGKYSSNGWQKGGNGTNHIPSRNSSAPEVRASKAPPRGGGRASAGKRGKKTKIRGATGVSKPTKRVLESKILTRAC